MNLRDRVGESCIPALGLLALMTNPSACCPTGDDRLRVWPVCGRCIKVHVRSTRLLSVRLMTDGRILRDALTPIQTRSLAVWTTPPCAVAVATDGQSIRPVHQLTAATSALQRCVTVPSSPRVSLRQAVSEGA